MCEPSGQDPQVRYCGMLQDQPPSLLPCKDTEENDEGGTVCQREETKMVL